MQIVVGTRGSELAKTQTASVIKALSEECPDATISMEILTTSGDKKQSLTGGEVVRDKRDWIAELEEAVVSRKIDAAVHSGKDCPVQISEETVLIPVLKRECPFDVFIGRDGGEFSSLPKGSTIGTSSARRRAQLLRIRSDLNIVELRGNVPTRIRKLLEGELGGIVLAEAGISRLNLKTPSRHLFDPSVVLPAINQGILIVQLRRDREDLIRRIQRISHEETRLVFHLERRIGSLLGGDCHSAIGNFASVEGGQVSVHAQVLNEDGSRIVESSLSGVVAQGEILADKVAKELISGGALDLI